MSRARLDDRAVQKRIDNIAFLKMQREELVVLENLKANETWKPLKSLLLKFMKAQEKLRDSSLECDFSNEAYHEAAKALAVKQALEYVVNLIDSPGGQIKKIDDTVIKLQDEIKLAEEGQLIGG